MIVHFTIFGAPRTKNRGMPIIRNGKPVLIPPKPYRTWLKYANRQLPIIRRTAGIWMTFTVRVDVTAIWYRDRAAGDEDNYKKSLGDFLQQARIIENDNLIHWTGECLLTKDAKRPRIEVTITCQVSAK